MKQIIYRLFFLILLIALSCNVKIKAQDTLQANNNFLIGTFLAASPDPGYTFYNNYDSVLSLGVSSVFQRAIVEIPSRQNSNFNQLSNFPIVYAANDSGTGTDDEDIDAYYWQNIDWISYFTQAKYRKWEVGEGEDLLFDGNVKIIREHGLTYTDPDGTVGYKTDNLTQVGDTIIKGPKYYQYPRYTYTQPGWNPLAVQYRADFRLKIDSHSTTSLPVCSLFVTTTYYDTVFHHWREDILADTLLITTDLDTEYQDFFLSYNYSGYIDTNNIPENETPMFMPGSIDETSGLSFNIGAKVQFKVQWLGNKELFVDRIEVYDAGPNGIWDRYFKLHPDRLVDSIVTYNDAFASLGNKLKYYYTIDEPHSIDSYEPLRKVQEILDNNNISADLLTHFYPEWDGTRDGDPTFPQYVALAQPKKLFFWYAPFTIDNTVNPPIPDSRDFTLWNLRLNLQNAHLEQPGFYIAAQAFGYKNNQSDEWDNWMTPTPAEIKAETMLSLAHGCRGIYYESYYSYCSNCADRVEGLVDFPENNYAPRPIWDTVKVLATRLNGTLGKTLMNLTYDAGSTYDGYLRLYPFETTSDLHDVLTGPIVSSRYLKLYVVVGEYTPVNFHAGFFKNQEDNNYFLLTNVITTLNRWAGIKVYSPVSGYNNYRFRNIEPEYNYDTTFKDSISIELEFPAGEGYLFQVAPIVKYGGKLLYDETISNNLILYDDLTIENGKTLTVNATYDCYANIYTKGTGKIQTVNGGTINFYNGNGIIAQGNPNILGTSSHKLTIDFGSPTTGTGIQLLQGVNAVINYCILKNSANLITAENSQFNTSVNHCDFQNTSSYAISLAGTSTRNPGINYCTFTNTDYGIFAAGQNSFTINENTFTDNKLAISLSQIASVQIIHNDISSDLDTLPGIFLSSCGGNIRKNTITGHSYGISLANSSPLIGDNYIYNNKINGIYVGTGSVPDLRGALVGLPNNKYPISGYNDIEDNGGYSLPAGNNDGSEIYFEKSNIQIDNGCNLIADDRTVSPPLITILYLMNGTITTDGITATYNAWGDTVYSARFGSLNVTYIPYNDEICDIPGSGSMLVMQDNDGNTLDTVYSAGPPDYTPTSTEIQYAQALEYMINRDYPSADEIYSSIISSTPGDITSEDSYLGLYKSARLQNLDSLEMAALREVFNSNLESITDSVMMKVVSQLSLLTLVDEKQYNNAINGFGDIILQNPETEEALFAEIDAMTTSLLAGNGNDTTLNKGLNKNLLVKGTQDFQDRLNKLIQKRFGAEANTKDKDIIPTEYSLYNNYPNPFNPTTIIRFEIPERTQVELVVYDILGRRVKSLINNEFRNPGRYEVSFNANSLASGVYIYKLTTKNYSQARKMLLVK